MNKVFLNKKFIKEYVYENLVKGKKSEEVDHLYHHNASYKDGLSIVRNGILSLQRLNAIGIRHDSQKVLTEYSNIDTHANGIDGISLSVVGLTDLYRDEDEYSPYNPDYLDLLISSSIKTSRYTKHYGNEFITYEDILPKDIRAIDFRLLKLIDQEGLEEKYNMIILLSREIKKQKLDIKLREMVSEVDLTDFYDKPLIKIKTS